jgi:hypothetical protein
MQATLHEANFIYAVEVSVKITSAGDTTLWSGTITLNPSRFKLKESFQYHLMLDDERSAMVRIEKIDDEKGVAEFFGTVKS